MNTVVPTSKIITVLLVAVVALSYSLALYFLDALAAGVILVIIAFLLSKLTVLGFKQTTKAIVVGIAVGLALYAAVICWESIVLYQGLPRIV